MKRKIYSRVTACLLCFIIGSQSFVCFADEESTVPKNVNINIDGSIAGITNPTSTEDGETWEGSKIYYGHNNYYEATHTDGVTSISIDFLSETRVPEAAQNLEDDY